MCRSGNIPILLKLANLVYSLLTLGEYWCLHLLINNNNASKG